MWWMTRSHLARLVDKERVARAVAAAEARTAGEIVVSISPFFWGSADAAARRAFARLGVDRAEGRAGVLLFFVPSRRRFVILGDEGIHARVGEGFWSETASRLSSELRRGRALTDAIVGAVDAVGTALAEHFPPTGPRKNRLSDEPELG